MGPKHLYFINYMYNVIKAENLASDNVFFFFFFAEKVCLVDDRIVLGLSLSFEDLHFYRQNEF